MRKNKAFTLAEVMITMALIGSIAVMTLSNVGTNIQKQTRLAEFKTGYSLLDVGLKTVMADKTTSASCYAACPDNAYKEKYGLKLSYACKEVSTTCGNLETALVKQLGVIRTCNNANDASCIPPSYAKGGDCFNNFKAGKSHILDNGMILVTDGNKSLTQFALDVNGRRGPNKWGEDMFTFAVMPTESKTVGNTSYISSVSILPPPACLLGASNTDKRKSSAQMLDAIMNDR